MNISGDTMIFRKEHEGRDGMWYTYSTGVSSKKQDGTWLNGYLDVRFRKGVVVENKTKIHVNDGFLSVKEYAVNGEKTKKLELVILDFDVVEAGYAALRNDDVPF